MASPDYRERSDAQQACIRRWMSATGLGPEEWASRGYAEAFAKAWDKDRMRNLEAVYQVTLATAGRVNRILGK